MGDGPRVGSEPKPSGVGNVDFGWSPSTVQYLMGDQGRQAQPRPGTPMPAGGGASSYDYRGLAPGTTRPSEASITAPTDYSKFTGTTPRTESAYARPTDYARIMAGGATTRPADVARPVEAAPARTAEAPAIGDRGAARAPGKFAEISYRDPYFDAKLWSGGIETLRITDLPKGVTISSWMDNNGYYLWFRDSERKPHYLPPGLKTIEVDGFVQNVDEMKIQASIASMRENDRSKQGFASYSKAVSPLDFAQRMGSIGMNELNNQEKWLRDAAAASPNNPYFKIYLADILMSQAFKPVMDQVASGAGRIVLNSDYTQQKLNEAIYVSKEAQQIVQKIGGHRTPNLDSMPPLSPFHLNPYSYNPDLYWSGGLYQAYQREVAFKALQTYINRFSVVELPPILPPK